MLTRISNATYFVFGHVLTAMNTVTYYKVYHAIFSRYISMSTMFLVYFDTGVMPLSNGRGM